MSYNADKLIFQCSVCNKTWASRRGYEAHVGSPAIIDNTESCRHENSQRLLQIVPPTLIEGLLFVNHEVYL